MTKDKHLLKQHEMAKLLGISAKTIGRMLAANNLPVNFPTPIQVSGRTMFKRSEIDNFLAAKNSAA